MNKEITLAECSSDMMFGADVQTFAAEVSTAHKQLGRPTVPRMKEKKSNINKAIFIFFLNQLSLEFENL